MSAVLQERTLLCILPVMMEENYLRQAVERKTNTYACQANLQHEGGQCYLLELVGEEANVDRVVEGLKEAVCGFGGRLSDFEAVPALPQRAPRP